MNYKTSMLVGYTGFVGSNLSDKYDFTYRINTNNKEEAYGKKPELLVYAGLRAEKFLANNDPKADLKNIEEAFEQIKKIEPKKLVLISTVDVYKIPVDVDEVRDKICQIDNIESCSLYSKDDAIKEYEENLLHFYI